MTVYVALLHSIVLTSERRVVMSKLREMAEAIGYRNARTVASTGNLVFEGENEKLTEIENKLEEAFEKTFGKHVDIIVRSDVCWMALASMNPFPEGNGAEVIIRVMRVPPSTAKVKFLKDNVAEPERIAMVGGDLWIDFAGKPSESKLLSALTTKHMGVGTLRNWNTVRRLAEMIA
jgi:uncharacterized protein (DUF1697 family)